MLIINLLNIITVQVHIQTMLISLPPGTSSFVPIGAVTLQLAPIFFNSMINNPKYSVKLWGIDHNINLQQISSPSSDPNKNSVNTTNYAYQVKFGVTTNLSKLTGYFRDMGILIINIFDSRSGKQIAICYVKLRRFIINDLMSEFQQKFQVLSLENQFKNNSFGNTNKKVLGEIKIKLELDVPLNGVSVQATNQLNNISIGNQVKNKKVQIQSKQYTRNIITEPYIFQNIYQNDNKPINKYRNAQRNRQAISEEDFQLEKGISKSGDYQQAKDLLFALQTKPKLTAVNALDFLAEDSLNNQHKYPNISELHRKYGPNNVCIQRMRLKLDQAKYLNPQKQLNSISINNLDNSDENKKGYICKLKNLQTLIGNNKDLKDFHISILNSEKDLTIIAQSLMKQIAEGGIYIKNVSNGNVVQLQNKGYKSRGIIKKSNIQGEPLKMYIKRKDTNKKVAEFDIFIENLQQPRIDLSPKKNINEPYNVPIKQVQIKTKSHFYVSVRPYNQSSYKSQQYVFSIHPEFQKQAVKGKKMIFTAENSLQNVKVKVQGSPPSSRRNDLSQDEIIIKIDPSIKMKEEILMIGAEKLRVFMASADTIQNLMKIVVLYDSNSVNQNKQIQMNQPHAQGTQHPVISHQRREQKLKLLFKCFHSLMLTTNSSCMEIINKLLSPSIASRDQVDLFQLMCKNADIPLAQSQMITHDVFSELLHGQFSMFWSCFQQYRNWNGMYNHAIRNAVKSLENSIGVNKKDLSKLTRKQRRVVQGSLQKLYRDKQQLFGLIPIDRCEKILIENFKILVGPSQGKNFTEQQQNLSSVQRLSVQRLQKITLSLRNLLVLLCRYTGGQSIHNEMNIITAHCVKIAQLENFLMEGSENNALFINQHQILAISEQKKHDKEASHVELLLEVVQSCISSGEEPEGYEKRINICDRLGQLLEQIRKIETQESSQIDEDYGRIQTDNNTYIHMNTQQPERLQTQQINNTYINIAKNKKQQSNAQESIAIHLKQLIIANELIPIPELNNSTIQVLSDKKIIKVIKYHELPKTIQLQNMKDYKIILTIYNEIEQLVREGENYVRLNQGQQWKFQGLFIANQKIERILLYSGDKEGMKQIGYIKAAKKQEKKENQQQKQQQHSELVIQIQKKSEVSFKKSFKKLKQQQYEEYQRQKQENESKQLIKMMKEPNINQKSLKEQKIISYKILSIWPPHSHQTFQIMIEGAQKIIQYPQHNCLGRLYNKDPQKSQIQIEIEPQMPKINSMTEDLKHKTKLNKVAGTQEIILQKGDGTLNCIVTIQLSQYIGDSLEEQEDNSHIQSVIYINIYHLQSYALLNQHQSMKEQQQYTIIITNESDIQPIYIKDINIKIKNQESPFNQGFQPYRQKQQWLRHQWIGQSAKVKKSKVFNIHIYKKPRQRTKSVQKAENLLTHFQFTIKYHPQNIGIFENKGYLVDQNKVGYRLAIDVLQINYNDVFSKNSIGRQKFQSLLTVFEVQNMMKINKSGALDTQKIKGVLRSLFGFNNMQIHLFFELQKKQNQIQKIITQWGVDSLLNNESINLSSYSILDIFSEFQIYDFFNSGVIPKDKAQLINLLIFDLNKLNHVTEKKGFLNLELFQIQNQQGWVRDLKFDKKDGNIDYILILWTLRQFAIVDNFFIHGELKSTDKIHKENIDNDITSKNYQNSTNLEHLPNQSISKIKTIQIELLSFQNLRINESPATLTFYINGEKVAQPIPRCFTYQYQNPKTIITNFPIILEVYNKKYGVKSLYEEQLVETIKIYQQKVNILGGQMNFLIEDDKQGNILNKNRETGNKLKMPKISQLNKSFDNLSNLNTNLNKTNLTNNQFRQSRKQKWENLKNRDQNTKKIAEILKNRTSSRQSK